MGVLGIRLKEQRAWTKDQEDLLLTLGRNLALSLEREMLAQEYRRNMMTAESERLSKVLLNTVSHELRTPLTTIKGSITALMDSSTVEDSNTRDELLRETLIASDRLNNIVGNLLSMSRLESGVLRLKKTWSDVNDLLSVALDHLRGELKEHPVNIHVPEDQPAVLVDFVLFVQVITNLVQNAAAYTPAGASIRIASNVIDNRFELIICDSGKGVSQPELNHLFDKFYRGSNEAPGGVGLGLAICRGIVEAHGGAIDAYNDEKEGLCVRIAIPDSIYDDSANEDEL
jgi:two-component system, OmpR family, sensor histidine kinase KdpD